MDNILFRQEAYAITGAVFDVNLEIGTGFLEAVYQECLAIEFAHKRIPFVKQPELTITYKGEVLSHTYRPDFICYDSIIVELKVVKDVADIHRAQVLNYLKATGLQLGLLVNFGCYPKASVERLVRT